jgi:signal transduction histidine kinase
MGATAFAYSVTASNDFFMFDDRLLLGLSLATRVLLIVSIGAALLLLWRARVPRQHDRAVNVYLIATAIFTTMNHLLRIPAGKFIGPLIAAAVLIAFLYFVQRGPILLRAIVGCVTSAVAVTVVLHADPPIEIPARMTCFFSLIVLNGVGVLSARAFEENRRQRFEAERRERHARQALAIEKERAEAMSHARAAFLAAMSHEFRTPMNAVIGLSDLLLDAPLANEHWRHVRTINESARALLVMLNEILDFAKIDAQKLALSYAPFDIRDLATSVVDMLRPQANKRSIEINLELSPDIPKDTIGDDARIRQALVNIVGNAVKFTERGSVKLRIDARQLERHNHEITFCVEDTGIGMSPEVLSRLFRPFEQADATVTRRYGGTGLGLAISKQIVNAMGGDIHVESEVGRGSVFSFKLVLETVTSPPVTDTAMSQDDHPMLTILVVDDNEINREVARAKLGQLGYFVDLAHDGPIGYRVCFEQALRCRFYGPAHA